MKQRNCGGGEKGRVDTVVEAQSPWLYRPSALQNVDRHRTSMIMAQQVRVVLFTGAYGIDLEEAFMVV
ncbi:hypothetical protein J6590_047666 [Homalodisca vitripennis]|nr:hypothetical protein J6590_047666 [Homalodisca vitripennis]